MTLVAFQHDASRQIHRVVERLGDMTGACRSWVEWAFMDVAIEFMPDEGVVPDAAAAPEPGPKLGGGQAD